MERTTSKGKCRYVAAVGMWSFVFKSYWLPGTFGIYADALQAAREAGIGVGFGDWDDIRIYGPYRFPWQARKAMKEVVALPDEPSEAPVAEEEPADESIAFEPVFLEPEESPLPKRGEPENDDREDSVPVEDEEPLPLQPDEDALIEPEEEALTESDEDALIEPEEEALEEPGEDVDAELEEEAPAEPDEQAPAEPEEPVVRWPEEPELPEPETDEG